MTAPDLNSALRDLAPALANHLWQSTAFVAAAGLLTLALRSNQARMRHWIWMAASLKFLLPFALLAGMAAHFAKPRVVAPATPAVYSAVEDLSEPFAMPFDMPIAAPVVMRPHWSVGDWLPLACAAVWLTGLFAVLTVWAVRWRRVARTVRAGEPAPEGREVVILRRLEQAAGVRRPMRIRLSQSAMEPGVFGIVRPVLAWPEGISERLDDAHLETVLAHEVCHVRRWDNLTALLHMFVEAAFWFHPLVWWMGARLVAERERACDEEVLQLLNRPQVYAESILKVCEFCVESPLECLAGVTGADLKKRIVEIMRARAVLRLTWGKKLLIGATMVCAIAVPVVLGQAKAAQRMMLAAIKAAPKPIQFAAHAMLTEGQEPAGGEIAASIQNSANREQPSAGLVIASASSPQFDAATIKHLDPNARSGRAGFYGSPGGRIFYGGDARTLIEYAFGLQDYQLTGGPGWIYAHGLGPDWLEINAVPPADSPSRNIMVANGEPTAEQRLMLQTLLRDRFGFKFHFETKEGEVYILTRGTRPLQLKPTEHSDWDPRAITFGPLGGINQPPKGGGAAGGAPHSGLLTIPDGARVALQGHNTTTDYLALRMSRFLQLPVLNRTGIEGSYDFDIPFDDAANQDMAVLVLDLVNRLGLKIKRGRGPIQTLVIDHIEKPTVDGAELVQPAASMVPVSMVQEKASSPPAGDSAQPAEYVPTMTFDVASVRQSHPDIEHGVTVGGGFEPINSSHWRVGNNDLMNLILQAYDINSHLIEGIPRSLGYPTTFNAEAKGDPAADEKLAKLPKEQIHLEQQHMIQTLLAERFHMKAHWETRDGPTYDLVVSRPGRLVSTGAPPSAEELKNFGDRPIPALYQKGDSRTGFEFIAHGATMESILPMLASQFGRPVTDKTGLTGKYNFDLKYYQTRASDRKDDETNPWAPLETAIQDQLGLKLVSTHGPVHYLVIDHVEMPTEN